MITEFFMPLDRQFDSGFGTTACAFHDAAKAIDAKEHRSGFGLNSNRLPVLYLYRHAGELFLKSILTIIHRRFGANYPRVDKNNFPVIEDGTKAKKIFQVHSLGLLFVAFRGALAEHAKSIIDLGRTDWTQVPWNMDALIYLIDKADTASTMFRYPVTLDPATDKQKSAYKEIDMAAVAEVGEARTAAGKPGIKLLALKNDEDEIVETFMHDDEAMQEVLEGLRELCGTLSGAHFGMLHEFLDTQTPAKPGK